MCRMSSKMHYADEELDILSILILTLASIFHETIHQSDDFLSYLFILVYLQHHID